MGFIAFTGGFRDLLGLHVLGVRYLGVDRVLTSFGVEGSEFVVAQGLGRRVKWRLAHAQMA